MYICVPTKCGQLTSADCTLKKNFWSIVVVSVKFYMTEMIIVKELLKHSVLKGDTVIYHYPESSFLSCSSMV